MSKEKQASLKPETKNGRTPPTAVQGQRTAETVGLAELAPASPNLAAAAGNPTGQASRLRDSRLSAVQRQAMARQIGQQQGNDHLARLIASVQLEPSSEKPNEKPGGSTWAAHPGRNGAAQRSHTSTPENGAAETLAPEEIAEGAGLSGAPAQAAGAPPNPEKGNGRAHQSLIQRAEEDDTPTEAEKAAALAAAQRAEGQAGQSASRAAAETDKSRNQQADETQSGAAAQQKAEQAEAEGKAQREAVALPAAPPALGEAPAAGAAERGDAPAGPIGGAAADGGAMAAGDGGGAVAAGENDKAPASPQEDPGFQAVAQRVRGSAARSKHHAPAAVKAGEAQAAAEMPGSEVEARAQANQVGHMEGAPTPGFNAAAYKARLMQRIQEMAPKNAQQADEFKKSNKLGGMKGEMQQNAAQERDAATGPLESAAQQAPDTGAVPPKPVEPLQPEQPGQPPAVPGAEAAAPKPKTGAEVEAPMQENAARVDDKMAEAGVSDEQLAKSNEPEFTGALKAKADAKDQAQTAPAGYRQFEQAQLGNAQASAASAAQEKTQAMHTERTAVLAAVTARKGRTKSEDEQARAKVAADIQGIYDQTRTRVEKTLADLDTRVATTFDEGAAAAKQAFEDFVDARMEAYKERRYGGWFGWARWLKDKVAGMPAEVNAFYQEGRDLFLQKMDAVIDNVVAIIGTGLAEAKAEIANGKKEIQKYIAGLPNDLRKVGQQAGENMESSFASLEQSVDAKQDELIDTLASKYQESLQAVDSRIEEMKAANRGLVDKALDLVVGVIKTILKLKDLLTTVLAKIAGVVDKIISDPIGFLGNMIAGIKQGFNNFVDNILTHLQAGLIGWLTGTLGSAGIQIPNDLFSLEGIFSLVMQILGISWGYIRGKAVKLLGEPVVKALETGFELFRILIAEGAAGLWNFVQEKFSDLKEMVIDAIKDMVITEVIKAGVKWVLGLLNPAGALIKAAMAIYDIVTFFIERGSQIIELVNAVVDGIAAVARGSIGGAAALIENALAKALPVVIGFLANLLGIGGLAKKVTAIIHKIRERIDKAIDALLMKAKKVAKKLLTKIRTGKGKTLSAEEARKAEKGDFTPEDRKAGLSAFAAEERPFVEGGKISHENASKVAATVKQKHPVFQSITVVDGKDSWNYRYVFRAESEVDTSTQKKEGGKVDVSALRGYRPGWSDEAKEELAGIYPEHHLPGTLRIVYEKAMSRKGKLYNRAIFNRNHITAYSTIRDELLNRLQGVSFAEAAMTIQNESNSNIRPQAETNESFLEAIKELLRYKFNDVANVYLGDARENQKNGSLMAEALEEMDRAAAAGDSASFNKAKAKYLALGFDPEPIDYFYDKFKSVRERA